MRWAEQSRFPKGNRVKELMVYAQMAGIKRLGIANCIVFKKETARLKAMLETEFEVFDVDCKHGRVEKGELLGEGYKGIMCNPAGQAGYLASRDTQLNVAYGLCMGHDLVFAKKSVAPVTTLLVKDRMDRASAVK